MTNELFKTERIAADESLFQKFFGTEGRIDRKTFFGRFLVLLFVECSLLFATGFVAILASLSLNDPPFYITSSFFAVNFAAMIPQYCLTVKRLHDIGKNSNLAKIFLGAEILMMATSFSTMNGFVILTSILSIATLVFTFYLLFKRGENKANEYGDVQ